MLLGFFYSKFKSKRVHELELENKRKQRLEITRVENSKLRQRIRVKQLRTFSYQLNFMLKSQISHIGHKRCIPENEFFSFMTEAIKSVMGVIETIDTVKSLRNISKEKLFLHKIPIHSLPKLLQVEVEDLCREMIEQEGIFLEFINSRLRKVSHSYSMAFSCYLSSCCQSFRFFVH